MAIPAAMQYDILFPQKGEDSNPDPYGILAKKATKVPDLSRNQALSVSRLQKDDGP